MTTWDQKERRQYIRIQKPLIISFRLTDDPSKKQEVTQLKNIGMGGICFISKVSLKPQSHITVEFKTPNFIEAAKIGGTILESIEKIPQMIYETRVAFGKLPEGESFILKEIIETFLKISKHR